MTTLFTSLQIAECAPRSTQHAPPRALSFVSARCKALLAR
jgi:hypothetical protein